MKSRIRVALIGASARGIYGFAQPILRDYRDTHELSAVLDISPDRVRVMNEFLGTRLPAYTDPGELYAREKPDLVIIAAMDCTHADYLEGAFRAGVNAIVEKPLCVDEKQCRRILALSRRYHGLRAITAHNYRYSPDMQSIKRHLDNGKIGALRSIVFLENLDCRHGSSYFRRWNRQKRNSGGLAVHKACHCFDLMNWFTGSRARRLVARGALNVYGKKASAFRGKNCHACRHAEKCGQYVDYASDIRKAAADLRTRLYFAGNRRGGYTPDLCVYSPEIDIEDRLTAGYDYENGVQAAFDLCAYASYEGVLIVLEGTTGRMEYRLAMDTNPGKGRGIADKYGSEATDIQSLKLYRFDGGVEALEMAGREGSAHGGADVRMLKDLLGGSRPGASAATLMDGVQAVLIGAAANRSMATGKAVDVQGLLK